ncbi:DDE family transposase [Haloarcula quadrata]|uniref:DDE family transposase n=1 Tax=Haloarcula quadrata TaxID=182779 RepID=A0A495QQQ8_9EURY|nr:transposase [Haloarcula quadrata]RKS75837.1 DDE family transposase [Haloarcula quadrata]RKS75956.1 DDE family transposase [Haloarcula quadrata]RKS76012.1 DDE family transposase [Haloarcula quadrata]RKS78516.1 DDE family transposase [Haloarcula quadrata]RKS81450.1 DDE family transposase [Haloarcula quadrata]
MSSTTATLQDLDSVDAFLNVAATETVPLFEHLEFEFLLEYDVFAPASRGRTRVHQPPDLFRGFLHCYYEDVYGTRPVARELQHGLVWYYCGLDKPPSRDTIDRFLTDLEHVIDDVFQRLVEQAAARGLLNSTYSIDSTHVEAIQYNDDASWNYDSTAEEHYYGFGCTIVSTGSKIPIAAEFTQRKQADAETAMRVTKDALAVGTPIWMLGDSAYDILEWHDFLLEVGIVPVAPYNPRNTDDPLDIEYRVEDRIKEHSEEVQLKQSVLDETYNRRTGVERTNDAVKDCGLGHVRARGRVHARTEVFIALCLRIVVAITNFERGDDPGREKLTL